MEASRAALPIPGVKQVVSDYFTLTKPKVQLLLLLTTITTMYVAGDPSVSLVAITVVGIVWALKKGPIAGPDPWKANTLEWFTPSPPPENNFDVIPRVRSVEPMKDIRREIEQRTGVEQRYRSGQPLQR